MKCKTQDVRVLGGGSVLFLALVVVPALVGAPLFLVAALSVGGLGPAAVALLFTVILWLRLGSVVTRVSVEGDQLVLRTCLRRAAFSKGEIVFRARGGEYFVCRRGSRAGRALPLMISDDLLSGVEDLRPVLARWGVDDAE